MIQFAANIINDETVHTVEVWKNKYIKDIDAVYVKPKLLTECLLQSSIRWAQIKIVSMVWRKPIMGTVQACNVLEANNSYTLSYLICDLDGSKLMVSFAGVAGHGTCYDIFITFEGTASVLDEHLKAFNINESSMCVSQQRKGK